MMYMCNTGSMRKTLLWENPDPTASFRGDTVSLSDVLSNYKFISVVFIEAVALSTNYIEVMASVDDILLYGAATVPAAVQYNVYVGANVRYFYCSGTELTDQLSFSDCMRMGESGTAHSALIPVKVYGINI